MEGQSFKEEPIELPGSELIAQFGTTDDDA